MFEGELGGLGCGGEGGVYKVCPDEDKAWLGGWRCGSGGGAGEDIVGIVVVWVEVERWVGGLVTRVCWRLSVGLVEDCSRRLGLGLGLLALVIYGVSSAVV